MIQHFKALSPSSISTIAPKEYVERGYDYFHKERLESFQWERNHSLLTAVVRGTKRYTVNVMVVKSQLAFVCTCPVWTTASQCKHVICALLTILNVLAPLDKTEARHQPRRLEELRATLLCDSHEPVQPRALASADIPTPSNPDDFELMIHLRHQQPELSVHYRGQRLYRLRNVPETLTYFVGDFYHSFPIHQDRFAQHLQLEGNRYPLVFESDGDQIQLTWKAAHQCEVYTELNVVKGQVTLQPVYVFDGIARKHLQFFWDYAVDLERQILVKVEEPPEWDMQARLYDEWRYGLEALGDKPIVSLSRAYRFWELAISHTAAPWEQRKTDVFQRQLLSLPLQDMQSLPLLIPTPHLQATRQRLILKVDGLLTPLSQEHDALQQLRYRFVISPATDQLASTTPMAAIRATCCWDECSMPPHDPTFSFFTYIERSPKFPAPLRTQKRKKILRETFLTLLTMSDPSKVESFLRTALAGKDFQRLTIKGAAKQVLKQFFSAFQASEVRLQCHRGHWHLLSVDKKREAQMYLLPYEQFGAQVFEGMVQHDEMRLPLDHLHQGLPHLYETCQARGIELWYHSKPVMLSTWALSLHAQRPAGIDWFELRPEIRCNNTLMERAAIQHVINHNGIIEQDDVVHILPTNAQEALRAISSFYQHAPEEPEHKEKNKEWVRVPRLQILDWIALRKHGVTLTLPPDDEAIFDRLTQLEHIEIPQIPQQLQAPLRDYQKAGYAWMAFLYQHRFGACLADDMGLGKTMQAISMFGGIKEGIIPAVTKQPTPHLVVLPPSLVFNWEQEIQKFYPSLRVTVYAGPDRVAHFAGDEVVLTTYGVVRRDIAILETLPFHLIVFDEAQTVKNIYAATTSAVRRLHGAFTLVMTGTPLENHIGEYFSLIDLCVPGLLGDHDTVKSEITSASSSFMEVLTRRTKPFVLRRTKEHILKELPPKTETDVYLDLTERQKSLYQHTVAQIRPGIEEAYQTKTHAQARIIALTAILKLRQICLSPTLLHADSRETSPKIAFVIERLNELMEAGHSALVFSQFTSFLDLVETALTTHHIPYVRLDGSTPTGKRRTLVKQFQQGQDASVFLLSLKAGGQGLNLTKASYVFHLDPWWNPAVENQASDRTHRIGQTQKVSIFRILMRHSIEEKMMALKQRKTALYQAVLDGATHHGTGTSITKDDFDFLLA